MGRHAPRRNFAQGDRIERFGADGLADDAFANNEQVVVLEPRFAEERQVLGGDINPFHPVHQDRKGYQESLSLRGRCRLHMLVVDLFAQLAPVKVLPSVNGCLNSLNDGAHGYCLLFRLTSLQAYSTSAAFGARNVDIETAITGTQINFAVHARALAA